MAEPTLKEFFFDQKLYEKLKRCSENKDMSEWNEWRRNNINVCINLDEADFSGATLNFVDLEGVSLKAAKFNHSVMNEACFRNADLTEAVFFGADLKKTDFTNAALTKSKLTGANLQSTIFNQTCLQSARLNSTNLQGAVFYESDCQGTWFSKAKLQGAQFKLARMNVLTTLDECQIDKETSVIGVGLDGVSIAPGLKAALKDNSRRIHWQQWLDQERKKGKWMVPWLWPWPVRLFWWVTDYGSSTKRIIGTFFALAFIFCLIYWLLAMIPGSQSIIDELRQISGTDSSKSPITFGWMHTLARSFYFSVVTMTTLGFGDMHAAKTGGLPSYIGYLFLSLQVLLGYIFLGALVTRLGILFTGEAPAAAPVPVKAKNKNDD